MVFSGVPGGDQTVANRLVSAMLDGSLVYLVSPALIDEYRRVLWRPQARRRHKLTPVELDRLLAAIAANGRMVAPAPAEAVPPDPGDEHLWALLEADAEAVLVTGDRALLRSPLFPGRIISLQEFAATQLPPQG